jgi:hypothetical protein
MSKGAILRISGTLVLLVLILNKVHPQTEYNYPIRLMFYNAENFFDTSDDTLRDDNEFLPGGLMRWNYERYFKKLNSVYKVIIAAGEWNPPAIVGFSEIENRKVLNDLLSLTYLSKFNYGIVHEESNDPRGIDVCLIYNRKVAQLLNYRYMIPLDFDSLTFTTRSILYSKWMISGDTIHIFLNHWPSRRGGVLAGEAKRESISGMIRTKTDSIQEKENGNAKIIIAGDFNCTPADKEISILLTNSLSPDRPYRMINLSSELSSRGLGTYRYMGTWEMIDQVMVSEALLEGENGLRTSQDLLRIFKPDFLLKKDDKYPGLTPYSTFSGYRYQGGFSDHLPVILDLIFRKPGY